MVIKRDKYLEMLKRRMWNGSVKIITGIRRCGKTTLLKVLFRDYLIKSGVPDDHIIIFSLEKLSSRDYRDPVVLDKKIKSRIGEGGKYYLFLDEIQYVKDFEDLLNEYVDDPRIDVYVSGSNSFLLSKDIITGFRGRGDEVRVHPLSFSEYYSAVGGDERSALKEYMLYGGMPKMLSITDDSDKMKYLSDLFDEVYLKDIVERNGLRNNEELSSLTDVLCSSIGSMTNPKRIADTMRTENGSSITRKTVVEYIDGLTDSFLFEECKRYDVKGRRYIGAVYKYYIEDVGLRNARLKFRQQEMTHLLENTIYNELRIRGFEVDIGIARHRKMKDGVSSLHESEVDFIASKGDRKYYIQSAYSIIDQDKRAKEIESFMEINDSFKKILITMDDVRMNIDDHGIITMNVYDFLLKEESLDHY